MAFEKNSKVPNTELINKIHKQIENLDENV